MRLLGNTIILVQGKLVEEWKNVRDCVLAVEPKLWEMHIVEDSECGAPSKIVLNKLGTREQAWKFNFLVPVNKFLMTVSSFSRLSF